MPTGISHEPDLSKLSHAERMEHHRKALRPIAFYQGADGVAEYRARYPEAKGIWTPISAGAILPKPEGYYPAWRRLVGLWLTDDAALGRTQGQDVDWLNAELGSGRFDRSRYLSKSISSAERRHAAEVFADRGLVLPDTVRTKADVKKLANTMKAQGRHGAKPFGGVGARIGDTLAIGGHSFTVQRLKGREFIRVSVAGTRRRLYLDELLLTAEWLVSLLTGAGGTITGASSLPSCVYTDRELATLPTSTARDPLEEAEYTSSSGELATSSEELPALRYRIAQLTATFAPRAPVTTTKADPLEL